jgi:hypothetical protein
MGDKENSPRSGEQATHICWLKQRGLMEEIDQRSSRPTVVCNKCGAKADAAAISAARALFEERPADSGKVI